MAAETEDRFAEFAEAVLGAFEGVEDQLRRIADALEAGRPQPEPRKGGATMPAPSPTIAAERPADRAEPPPLNPRLPRPDDWRYALVGGVGLPEELLDTLARHRVPRSAALGPLDDVGPASLAKLDGVGRPQLREIGDALKRARAPREVWQRWRRYADR